jgi:hypothetical protein
MHRSHEFKAPWGRLLKGISFGVLALITTVSVWSADVEQTWWPLLLPVALFAALPFMVRGYAVADGKLIIKRPGRETTFPLDNLQSVEAVPNAMKGAIRLFGNGGLFSFTGLYRNKALGSFRAFVNDLNRTVVLRFPERTLVVSPDDPEGFVERIHRAVSGKSQAGRPE